MSRSILEPTPDRLLLVPVKDNESWTFYKEAVANFWTAEEIDLGHDQFHKLDGADRKALMNVLAFFAAADGIVGENLAMNLIPKVQVAEMRAFYTFQAAIETVHAEVYGNLIQAYVSDTEEQTKLFRAIETCGPVKKLGDWAKHWTSEEHATFSERLVAFACVEGILFSGPFCVVFYFKTRGLLPGLCKSNEFIARDEAQHMRFACMLYKDKLLPHEKTSAARVHEIVRECVDLEVEFINYAIGDMPGLNARTMTTYVQYVADVLLTLMGVEPLYNSTNPYAWMTMVGMPGKTNFFEGRVADYQRAPALITGQGLDGDDF